MKMKRIFRSSNSILFIFGITFFILNYQNKEIKVNDLLEKTLNSTKVEYHSIEKYYSVLANNINAMIINDPSVVELFSKAKNANKEQQKKIREQMYALLKGKYKYLSRLGFRQVHFHLPDNTSFLRMHKVEKFGDNLSAIRHSIKTVNETLKPIEGFEEGRIVNGFRYVFPMFSSENEHIGSVEVSISSNGYIKMFKEHFFSSIHFLIKKSEVHQKVFFDEVKNSYENSLESTQYYSERVRVDDEAKQKVLTQDIKDSIESKLKTQQAFVLYAGNNDVISFLPIKNIRDKEVVAYFSIYTKDETIEHVYSIYNMVNIIILFALFIIIFFLDKDYISAKQILKQKVTFETLFEKSSDGVLIIENGKFTQCNETIVKMLKYKSKEEFLSTHPSKLSPPKQPDGQNSIEKADEMIARSMKKGSYTYECVHSRANGDQFWVDVVLTPISLDEKDVIHVVWRDISDRKEMEVKLKEYTTELEIRFKALEKANLESKKQEEYLKKSQAIAHSGVWEHDAIKDTLYWSDEVYNIFGLDKKTFKPTYSEFLQHVQLEDRKKLDTAYFLSVLEQKEYYCVHRIKKDGMVRYIEERGSHSYDEQGELVGTTGVALDITRKKELELELLRLNKNLDKRIKEEVEKNKKKDEQLFTQSRLAQMGEMISMIAHQWRQPLSAISATAANLETKIHLDFFDTSTEDGKKEQNEYFLQRLHSIDDYVDTLTITIDDFRNFYKPNKAFNLVTFEEVTNKALVIINASLENNGIEVVFTRNDTLKLEMYDNEMMQVILNIFKNSQDNFLDKKISNPKIFIDIHGHSLSITDNGGGIAAAILDKIFDPYFSTKDEKNGTGLGLYMSKIIVEEHHQGKLLVENKGEGVCFTVDLSEVHGKMTPFKITQEK